MKTRWMHLIAGLTVSVLCLSMCITTSSAALVWEDNFNDGDLDDWTIFGYENTSSQVEIEGNFSATSQKMTSLDDNFNAARHNSTTIVGTWSFDMFVPDDGFGTIYFGIITNGNVSWVHDNTTFIAVGPWMEEDKFVVWEMSGDMWWILSNIHDIPLQGWHHIEFSRTSEGHFYVFFNDTLKADFDSLLNPDITCNQYVQFSCNNASGAALDNLVVDDEPKVPPVTTSTTTTTTSTTEPTPTGPGLPTDLLMYVAIGAGVGLVVIVLVVLVKRR